MLITEKSPTLPGAACSLVGLEEFSAGLITSGDEESLEAFLTEVEGTSI